jgi:NodT family efflux transporter outer membrane factor (OMF) lipoprotein
MSRGVIAFVAAALLAACVSAPEYQPPTVVVAPAFRAISDSGSRYVVGSPVGDTTASPAVTSPGTGDGASAVESDSTFARESRAANAVRTVGDPPDDAGKEHAYSRGFVRSGHASDRGADEEHVSSEAPDTRFWRGLGDSTLTLLISEALDGNPDVHVARARLRSARAARRLSAFDFAPTVTARAGFTRQQLAGAQFPGVASQLPRQDLWDGGFDASWELDIFGRIGRTVRAGGAFVSSAQEDVHDTQLSLAAEVARTYFELRGAQSELAVANRNAENQRRTVALTEERLAAGRGTAFDTERAKAELSLTLSGTPAIEARIAASQYRLATLLGRSPEALPRAILASAELPELPDVVSVGSPAELVRRRPDVLSAERQLAAETMLVGAARTDYLPRLSIGGSVGYTSTAFDALGNAGTSRFLVGPVLSWPFLDIGRVRTRVDEARAHADEARAHYTSAVLGAIEEAETAIVAYERARARLTSLSDAARSSAHAAELAQLRFQEGATDFLQVLDAQRTLLSAESQLAIGRTAAATALVALYKAVGGAMPPR